MSTAEIIEPTTPVGHITIMGKTADDHPPFPPPGTADREPSPPPAEGTPRREIHKEIGGPKGPEPTRYGDWEVGGRCTDF